MATKKQGGVGSGIKVSFGIRKKGKAIKRNKKRSK